MRTLSRAVFAIAVAVGVGLVGPVAAQDQRFDEAEVGEIQRIVRDYLIANPAVLREVIEALDELEAKERDEKLLAALAENRDTLLRDAADAVVGNPAGDITLVEFFDYNCGFCKRALDDMQTLLDTDAKLRVVLKEFPILTPGSIEAAKVSMAAAKQTDFWAFHRELLGSRGAADEKKALRVARDLGLDMEQLERDMADPAIAESIARTHKLALDLGVDGTPAYIVGDTLVPGAIGVEGLQSAIDKARTTACQTC